MKIEKLNNDKIKVTLSPSDLFELNIDVKQLTPDSKELHAFLFQIMETIREETDFNPYSGQVVVEATPSLDGMSITVSRISLNKHKITKQEFKKVTAVRAKTKKYAETAIFLFDNFDDMCEALKQARKNELIAGSLYKLDENYCFIIKNDVRYKRCIAMMREFARSMSGRPVRLTYIKEHGIHIASGMELVNMSEKIKLIM